MSQTGEAAEQIVNMATNLTVKGVECVTNLAGKGALSLATFLIAALKDEKRVSGKTRMRSFRGKPTRVFVIRQSELKEFAREAKKYGVLYAAVVDKKNPEGLCDIVVNAEDAARVNRIADRYALSTVDVDKIREDINRKQEAKRRERPDPAMDKAHTVDERDLDEMLGSTPGPVANENPTLTRANPSGRTSGNSAGTGKAIEEQRPSVRKEIKDIKEGRAKEKQPRQRAAHLPEKNTIPKSKGR